VIKITTLIPTTYNDGKEVSPQVFKSFEKAVMKIAGGYSLDGLTKGGYMEGEEEFEDISRRYIIIVPNSRIAWKIKKLVTRIGKQLQQYSMYYEQQRIKVKFIETK
jgi:hypothetical protein